MLKLKTCKKKLLLISLLASSVSGRADTVPTMFSRPIGWEVGAEISPAWVPGTNSFLKRDNPENKNINAKLSGDIRADFKFNPETREGILYKGLYQGLGLGVSSYFSPSLLGTPISAYIFQGAPVFHINQRLWLGYEWQFGAAFGWKHYNEDTPDNNAIASTSVTAHMALSFKFHYALSERWEMSFGIGAHHNSNGNTSWPNAGINSIGANIGVSYALNPQKNNCNTDVTLEADADSHRWLFDIMAYGAWRKRIVNVGETEFNPGKPELCPGKFGILCINFSPLYSLNRWVAIGPAVNMQWDESAGLEPYWVEGSSGDNIRFERPPFGKQISAGVSAHAELTMPIFSVNAGMGYDFINPVGNKRFYQSLTLKTFVTRHLYLNVGYRLGNFNDPQNLMLGVGIRF